jgi:NAD-dependent deacetylase
MSPMEPLHTLIAKASDLIAQASRPVVFTGAGVSKESGIPTFRDAMDGLWAKYDPEELATPEAFTQHPDLVWRFYAHRRAKVSACAPNAAHRAIVELEALKPSLVVITQNVDGFHQAAGSNRVITLHGNILENRCHFGCEGTLSWSESEDEAPLPPPCRTCGRQSMRPNVVWFGEELDRRLTSRAHEAVAECDLMIVVGTSGLVYPAAAFPEYVLGTGKPLIEINPRRTEFSQRATVYLPCLAGEALPKLVALMSSESASPNASSL